MQRIVEPELMDDVAQVEAYNAGNKQFGIDGFLHYYEKNINITNGKIVDLGCGTADYLVALAKKYPDLTIVGYDGSLNMVKQAQENVQGYNITVICKQFSDIVDTADCAISINTLHHLHDPSVMWRAIRSISNNVLVMDIIRPQSIAVADAIVNMINGQDPEIFKRDFYNSLLAAFSLEELQDQIKDTNYNIQADGNPEYFQVALIHGVDNESK
jgi:SAM-dependent methyltransferase